MPRRLHCLRFIIASAKQAHVAGQRHCSSRASDPARRPAHRLGWAVYQVQALSDAEKALALRTRAGSGFALSHEVTQYLLRTQARFAPLLAVLDALDEHCLRLQRGASCRC